MRVVRPTRNAPCPTLSRRRNSCVRTANFRFARVTRAKSLSATRLLSFLLSRLRSVGAAATERIPVGPPDDPSHSSSSPPCILNAVKRAPEPQNFPRLASGAKPPAAGPVRRPKLWRPTPFLSRRLSFSARTCTCTCTRTVAGSGGGRPPISSVGAKTRRPRSATAWRSLAHRPCSSSRASAHLRRAQRRLLQRRLRRLRCRSIRSPCSKPTS